MTRTEAMMAELSELLTKTAGLGPPGIREPSRFGIRPQSTGGMFQPPPHRGPTPAPAAGAVPSIRGPQKMQFAGLQRVMEQSRAVAKTGVARPSSVPMSKVAATLEELRRMWPMRSDQSLRDLQARMVPGLSPRPYPTTPGTPGLRTLSLGERASVGLRGLTRRLPGIGKAVGVLGAATGLATTYGVLKSPLGPAGLGLRPGALQAYGAGLRNIPQPVGGSGWNRGFGHTRTFGGTQVRRIASLVRD